MKIDVRLATLSIIAGIGIIPAISCLAETEKRIVTLGPMPAEVIIELGSANSLIGIDASAGAYAPKAPNATMLNYHRTTSSEGVLSLKPTHVIITSSAGPPAAIEQIRSSGVPLLKVQEPTTWDQVTGNVLEIARFVGVGDRGKEIESKMQADKQLADERAANRAKSTAKPRVLFVLRGGMGGNLLCAGDPSSAGTVISLANGANAATGFKGYKPIGTEALIGLNPDIILFPTGGGPHGGPKMGEDLKNHPGLKVSNAVANDRIYGVNLVQMLGFGPSLGPMLGELVDLFYKLPSEASAQASTKP